MLRMDALPSRHTHYGSLSGSSSGYGSRTWAGSFDSGGLPEYLRRILDYRQMDIEAAFEDITMLCSTNPQRMYKMAFYRKQTKNHWARDDPALAVIELLFLVATSIAYGLAFRMRGPTAFLLLILRAALLDWLAMGLVVATVCRWVANKYLLQLRSHSVEQEVEWRYAFDIHTNAFLPFFLVSSVLQYILLPILMGKSLVAMLLSNLLWAAAFTLYFYITHVGYRALPFLHKTEVFLYPSTAALFLFVLCLALGFLGEPYRFQATRAMAWMYFRR